MYVVRLLNMGRGAALAGWLLGDGDDREASLRKSLEARFDQMLVALQRTYLHEGSVRSRDEHDVLADAWIDGFVQALAQLPVASLRVVSNTDIVAGAHRRLTYDLDRLPALHDAQGRIQPQLRSAWLALFAAEGASSWFGLVERVRELLVAIRQTGVALSHESLRETFGGWLDELRRAVTGHLGVAPWVDPRNLAQTGWGIVFPARISKARCEALQRALAPLLAQRRAQARDLFFVFADHEGYRPGDTASAFLGRAPRGATAANPADPETTGVPYYLLLIGSPERFPLSFSISWMCSTRWGGWTSAMISMPMPRMRATL